MQTLQRSPDPAPPRPRTALPPPTELVSFTVDVDVCHLANPVVAVQQLLATDGNTFARVTGDEHRFRIDLVGHDMLALDHAEAWIRWAVHHAGVRGAVTAVPPQ